MAALDDLEKAMDLSTDRETLSKNNLPSEDTKRTSTSSLTHLSDEEKPFGLDAKDQNDPAIEIEKDEATVNSPGDQSHADSTTSEPKRNGDVEEKAAGATPATGEDYSVLTSGQKKAIIMTASLASLFSPMATAIYYPSLDTISKDLNVSNSQINITITLFLVIQGIAPSFVADIADRQGRRPMYILCFILFTAANLGLALQNNYVALLILRMLQAAGSSSTVALANGVAGDIVTSAERGSYIGYASVGGMLGPMIAPILGGIIGQYAGWHWIFWFLMIFSAVIFIPLILWMPETCRAVVDNGSLPPPFFSQNLSDRKRHKKRIERGEVVDEVKWGKVREGYRWRWPNPTPTLRVLVDLESAILLMATGLGLGCYYALSTGASVAFSENYGFNQVKIGLMFIPVGFGAIISALTVGRLVDWNYRRWCTSLSIPIIKNRRADLTNFPIERARLEVAFPMFFISGAVLIIYGWILTTNVSIAVPIVLFLILGYSLTGCFQVLNVLMVDIHPGKPSVAAAANNFVRCEIGAVFTAVLLPLVNRVGWGWAYTILALLFMGFAPFLLVVMVMGPKWRAKRKVKEDKKKALKEEKKALRIQAGAEEKRS